KQRAARRIRVQGVRELGFDARGFVCKRERTQWSGQVVSETLHVLRRLPLHPAEGGARRLCLDDPDCRLIDKEHVVDASVTGQEDELTNRNATTSRQVHALGVLYDP